MPVRHFYLLSHYICDGYSFYFLLVGSRRNESNSLWEGRGERSEDYCYPESMPARHFYLLSHYICDGYSFYFLLVGSRRNEFNSLWGDKGGYVRSLLLARKVYHPEEKDDISSQYNSEFIVYNDSWRYHLISMTVSRR